MTIAITGGLVTERSKVTDTSITTVLNEDSRVLVASIEVCPTSGTPNLSISVYDGTTRYYKRVAVAMTAGTPYINDAPFMLEKSQRLEVTSSASGGDMDVEVTYVNPTAAATVRGST